MRYFCWNLVSTPSANSEGYPILKTELGSNRVRGRKNRKKARNHAVRNAVTAIHTRRRRRRSMSVFDGPDEESPAAAAAFDVPTAGVPTYFVASTAPVVAGFTASGFGAGLPPSGSAIRLPPVGSLLVGCHQSRGSNLFSSFVNRYARPNAFAQSFQHQLSQRRNKLGRIVQPRAHLELRNAEPPRLFAHFVIDLTQRLHVIGNKRNRPDPHFLRFLGRQILQSPVQGRLQPFARSHFALVAEPVTIGPSAALHQKAHRILNVALVRISLCNHRHGYAVCAENNLSALGDRESSQGILNFFDHCV